MINVFVWYFMCVLAESCLCRLRPVQCTVQLDMLYVNAATSRSKSLTWHVWALQKSKYKNRNFMGWFCSMKLQNVSFRVWFLLITKLKLQYVTVFFHACMWIGFCSLKSLTSPGSSAKVFELVCLLTNQRRLTISTLLVSFVAFIYCIFTRPLLEELRTAWWRHSRAGRERAGWCRGDFFLSHTRSSIPKCWIVQFL